MSLAYRWCRRDHAGVRGIPEVGGRRLGAPGRESGVSGKPARCLGPPQRRAGGCHGCRLLRAQVRPDRSTEAVWASIVRAPLEDGGAEPEGGEAERPGGDRASRCWPSEEQWEKASPGREVACAGGQACFRRAQDTAGREPGPLCSLPFWLHPEACGILVLPPGIKPGRALEGAVLTTELPRTSSGACSLGKLERVVPGVMKWGWWGEALGP